MFGRCKIKQKWFFLGETRKNIMIAVLCCGFNNYKIEWMSKRSHSKNDTIIENGVGTFSLSIHSSNMSLFVEIVLFFFSSPVFCRSFWFSIFCWFWNFSFCFIVFIPATSSPKPFSFSSYSFVGFIWILIVGESNHMHSHTRCLHAGCNK